MKGIKIIRLILNLLIIIIGLTGFLYIIADLNTNNNYILLMFMFSKIIIMILGPVIIYILYHINKKLEDIEHDQENI